MLRATLSGSYDRTVRCWDFDSGECLRTFSGHQRSVFCLVYIISECYYNNSDDDDDSSSSQAEVGNVVPIRVLSFDLRSHQVQLNVSLHSSYWGSTLTQTSPGPHTLIVSPQKLANGSIS